MHPLENFAHDLHHATRQLSRSRGFALMAILTLALGIGTNSAIFSIVEAVLVRALPYQHPERLVVVWQTDAAHHDSGAYFNSYREFDIWRQHGRRFESSPPSPGQPALGHFCGRADRSIYSPSPPASTSFPCWVCPHNSAVPSPRATSRSAAPSFSPSTSGPANWALPPTLWAGLSFPPCVLRGHRRHAENFFFYPVVTDAWSLITPTGEFAQKPWNSMTGVFGLLRPGVSRTAAESELTAIQGPGYCPAPPNLKVVRSPTPDVLDLHSNFTWLAGRNLRKGLWLLLTASSLILLMASLNVGSLLLGRSTARSRELAVRVAIGATSRHIVLQAMTASLVLGFLGSSPGWRSLASSFNGSARPTPSNCLPAPVSPSTGACFCSRQSAEWSPRSSSPSSRMAWNSGRSQYRSEIRIATAAAASLRATSSLVVIQVALSMVLLAGAVPVSESLWKLTSEDLGYHTDHLFTARIDLPQDTYASPTARAQFADRLESQLTTIPGVLSVPSPPTMFPAA